MASQVHCRSWHVLDISSCHGTRLQYHVLYYFLLLIEIQVKINYYCFSLVFKFSASFNSKQKQRTKILRKLRIKHRLKPF